MDIDIDTDKYRYRLKIDRYTCTYMASSKPLYI